MDSLKSLVAPFTLLLRCSKKNGVLAQISFGMLHALGDALWGNIFKTNYNFSYRYNAEFSNWFGLGN